MRSAKLRRRRTSRSSPAAPDVCLHRWIERQAALTPGATAVVGESESLTYRELDARANRLVRRLRRMGVRVDEPVAICAEATVPPWGG